MQHQPTFGFLDLGIRVDRHGEMKDFTEPAAEEIEPRVPAAELSKEGPPRDCGLAA
jgi:hypothetical protein